MIIEPKLQQYLKAIELGLPHKTIAALNRIPVAERYVMAIRGYLQNPDKIRDNWAWSDKDEIDFRKTTEYVDLMDAVEQVTREFVAVRPGHNLKTNKKFRSLDRQIDLWNGNQTVMRLGGVLLTHLQQEIGDPAYPEEPDSDNVDRLKRFIKTQSKYVLGGSPTHATPGLSDHGHLDAFDFVVLKGGVVVAGTETARIEKCWEIPGYTEDLKTAVNHVNCRIPAVGKFNGPLKKGALYEPWHYVFERYHQA
jgi:hypothetical protein